MAKKKKPVPAQKEEFNRNPFNSLKGFAVSVSEENKMKKLPPAEQEKSAVPESFAEEMKLLGVERLPADNQEVDSEFFGNRPRPLAPEKTTRPEAEEDLFLEAMGELQVRFADGLPAQDEPRTASARRMKQLKQGKLVPEASLDLHGLQRSEVVDKLHFFLQNALHQGWRTVLVITGKGLHSENGEPILRNETERFLAGPGRKWVAEWGWAPKEYGGTGALVVFLRKAE